MTRDTAGMTTGAAGVAGALTAAGTTGVAGIAKVGALIAAGTGAGTAGTVRAAGRWAETGAAAGVCVEAGAHPARAREAVIATAATVGKIRMMCSLGVRCELVKVLLYQVWQLAYGGVNSVRDKAMTPPG
jgi:hypothetical protein